MAAFEPSRGDTPGSSAMMSGNRLKTTLIRFFPLLPWMEAVWRVTAHPELAVRMKSLPLAISGPIG
jgi:hypothetical protein